MVGKDAIQKRIEKINGEAWAGGILILLLLGTAAVMSMSALYKLTNAPPQGTIVETYQFPHASDIVVTEDFHTQQGSLFSGDAVVPVADVSLKQMEKANGTIYIVTKIDMVEWHVIFYTYHGKVLWRATVVYPYEVTPRVNGTTVEIVSS